MVGILHNSRAKFEFEFPFIEGNSDTDTFRWLYYNTGQQLFSWHPPNGYPDVGAAWISSSPRDATYQPASCSRMPESRAAGVPSNRVEQASSKA